jgi:hypothetical protein
MPIDDMRAIELLKEIVVWWEEWSNSEFPTELDDPPITESQNLLKSLGEL